MAIKRPDIYEHNNPRNAIVDSDFVRGGFRTSVESLQELFNLDEKSDQLKEYATFVYVKSEEKVYTLVDKDNIENINGWSTSVVVSGASLQSDWEQQDSQEGDYIKNKPTKTSDFKNDGEDGTAPYLTVTDVYRQNAILRGEYYYIEDFDFFFWADLYVINNTAYDNYISEEITLEPSDPTYDRIDVVVVNNDETISVITGTPSINPVKPRIDPTTQVEFTFFLVKAGSTTMDEIQTLVVYDENLQIVGGETNTSKNTTRVTLDSNEQSYSGNISVKYQHTEEGDKSTYRFDSLQNLSEYSKIIFFVYQDLQGSAAENAGKMRFNIVFKTQNSNDNIRVYHSYVYHENITNEWSPLILSIGDSTFATPTTIPANGSTSSGEDFLFDLIEISTRHSGLTFYIDYIVLQTGNPITQPFLIERTSQIPINDGNTGDSRYVEEKELTDVIIKKYYDNVSDMIYDQPNQTKGQLLIVKDAIADSNLEFSSDETRRQATYQYEETTTGTIVDYKVLAVPFGGISGGGGSFVFQDDIVVALSNNKTFGKYLNGDTIPLSGKTFEEAIKDIAIETINPTFVNPSYSLSSSITGTKEVGEEFDVILTGDFNRGAINGKIVDGVWNATTKQADRAGAPLEYRFEGVTNGVSNTKTISNYKTVLGSNSFQSQVFYSEGPQPVNSIGDDFDIPLPEGDISATTSYSGALRRFFGVGTDTVNPRTLSSIFDTTSLSQTFDIDTGTTQRFFHLYIPNSRELEKVELVEASYADITSQYVLQGVVQVPDAAGDLHDYKYYKMEVAKSYDSSVTHRIKIKNA